MRSSRRVTGTSPWSALASLLAAVLFTLFGAACADPTHHSAGAGRAEGGGGAAGDAAGSGTERAADEHAGHAHAQGEEHGHADEEEAEAAPAEAAPAAGGGASLTDADPAIVAVDAFIGGAAIDKADSGWKTKLPMPDVVAFTEGRSYFWHMNTNKGAIKIRLMPEVAPMHCTSTIYLTRLGFYDDVLFHRVIPDFMAQGGDPLGVGRGGPGYKYAGEFDPNVKHDRPGLLSMANAGPGTDGSQFFLTFVPTPWLDGKHTIFGEVVDGMDAVKALEKEGTAPNGRTRTELKIESATISVE